jgi:hypothetical protein
VLYPATEYELGPVESILNLPADQRPLNAADWVKALESHTMSVAMAELVERGDVEGYLAVRQEALESQLETFLRQRCEWEFEDTPPLDSLVLDDEAEAEELSDDSS